MNWGLIVPNPVDVAVTWCPAAVVGSTRRCGSAGRMKKVMAPPWLVASMRCVGYHELSQQQFITARKRKEQDFEPRF